MTKDFGGLVALRNVDLSVEQGEIVGLIGPNGAGKTTLFNLITGVLRPTVGHILFRGENLVGLPPHLICRRGIARTFQTVRPFLNHTVWENVLVGAYFGHRRQTHNPSSPEARAAQVVEFLGLAAKRNVRASDLTIQDRKLVEVGRALAAEPELLLLDEPMAGLNPTEIKGFTSIISRVHATGITVMIVEHIMRAIMNISTRIVVLHHGEKLTEGTPAEVAADRRVIDVYLGETYAA